MRRKTELPKIEPVILALVLDREARTERVVVGAERMVKACLEGQSDQQVLFDQERPLGTLIYDHDDQDRGEWNAKVIYPLCQALKSIRSREIYEQEAWGFVKEAMESDNPVTIYTACNLMALYCPEMCNRPLVVDILEGKMLALTRPYSRKLLVTRNKHVIEGAVENSKEMLQSASMKIDVKNIAWHSWKECCIKCVVARDSTLPQIHTYLVQLLEWKCRFIMCEICGRPFAAFSGHYLYCGMKTCDRIRNRLNKKANYVRGKENQYDKQYSDTRDGFRKKINKLKERSDVSEEQIDQAEKWYERFRKEGRKRKKQLGKNNPAEVKAFCDWLFEQQRVFAGFFGK